MEALESRVKTCRLLCDMRRYPEYSKMLKLTDRSKVLENKIKFRKGGTENE